MDESFYSPYEYRRRRSEPVEGVGGDRPPVIWSELPEALRGKVFYADIHSVGEVPDGRIVVLTTANGNGVAEQRAFFLRMEQAGKRNPVIVKRSYRERSLEALQVKAAADTGMLFLTVTATGFGSKTKRLQETDPSAAGGLSGAAAISAAGEARVGDAMSAAGGCSGKEQAAQIAGPGTPVPGADDTITPERIDALSLAILQAARVRISKAEYIACPSCGRTLYDLQETLAAIKARTAHLVGVKIGVMGCIVNGPGEMADADWLRGRRPRTHYALPRPRGGAAGIRRPKRSTSWSRCCAPTASGANRSRSFPLSVFRFRHASRFGTARAGYTKNT